MLGGQLIKTLKIIEPFHQRTVKKNNLSFGVGPAGYDVRVEFDAEGKIPSVYLAPGQFILASTVERFNMPYDVGGIVHDKSTWIRRGLSVHNTVIEPGWCGYLTVELKNVGRNYITVDRGDPIAQVVFHRVEGAVKPYEGKYQNQERGPQNAK